MTAVERGRQGEEYTALRLAEQGWTILERNYHSRWGEIDLIAAKGEILAFIEVKTRGPNRLAAPAAAVDRRKQKKILLTAQQYLLEHPLDLQPRFDVAEVFTRQGETFVPTDFSYLPGAFDASD